MDVCAKRARSLQNLARFENVLLYNIVTTVLPRSLDYLGLAGPGEHDGLGNKRETKPENINGFTAFKDFENRMSYLDLQTVNNNKSSLNKTPLEFKNRTRISPVPGTGNLPCIYL